MVSGVVTGCNARIKPHVALQTRIGSEGGPTGGQTGASHLPGGVGGLQGPLYPTGLSGTESAGTTPAPQRRAIHPTSGRHAAPRSEAGRRRHGGGTGRILRRVSGIADRGSDGCSFVLKRKPVAVNW